MGGTKLLEAVEVLQQGQGCDEILEHIAVECKRADVMQLLQRPLQRVDSVAVQVKRFDLHVGVEPLNPGQSVVVEP